MNTAQKKKPIKETIGLVWTVVVILFFLIHFISSCGDKNSSSSSSPSSSSSTVTKIGEWYPIQQDWVGFINESDLEHLDKLLMSKDTDAGDNFIGIAVATGRAVFFDIGEEVYLSDIRVFKEYVKIRRRGDTTEYWAFSQILEKSDL